MLWKSRKIWPIVAQPDIFISLKTETSNCFSSKMPKLCHIYGNSFIPRLFHSFFSFFDSQKTWQDLIISLDERFYVDYFSLNITLASQKRALDNISSMDSLWKKIYSQPMFNNLNVTVFTLLTTIFFLELSKVSLFSLGQFHCQGTICYYLKGKAILLTFGQVCKLLLNFYIDTKQLDQVNLKNSICYPYQKYSTQIHYYIWHPKNIITLYF